MWLSPLRKQQSKLPDKWQITQALSRGGKSGDHGKLDTACRRAECYPIHWPVSRRHVSLKLPDLFCWGFFLIWICTCDVIIFFSWWQLIWISDRPNRALLESELNCRFPVYTIWTRALWAAGRRRPSAQPSNSLCGLPETAFLRPLLSHLKCEGGLWPLIRHSAVFQYSLQTQSLS